MPNFAIMRSKKLKGMGSVASALQHCYRDRETPNADQAKTPDNEHLAARTTDEAMGRLRERLPEKHRKDAVLAVEYVLTASPEWWQTATPQQQKQFFDRSMAWLEAKYGENNIVAATVHRDEISPHLSAFVVPRTADGRLSAKEFIGNRDKMTRDQTAFAQQVADLGLERGIQGSRATHQRVRTHYANIERAEEGIPTIEEADLKPRPMGNALTKHLFSENSKGIALRLTEKVRASVQPVAAKAATADQERRRAKELHETLAGLQKRFQEAQKQLERFRNLFKGLSREQIDKVIALARTLQKQNEQQKEQERLRSRSRGPGLGG